MAEDITDILALANIFAVPVVASVISVDSLHPALVPGRGRKKGFDAIVNLKLPSAVSWSVGQLLPVEELLEFQFTSA